MSSEAELRVLLAQREAIHQERVGVIRKAEENSLVLKDLDRRIYSILPPLEEEAKTTSFEAEKETMATGDPFGWGDDPDDQDPDDFDSPLNSRERNLGLEIEALEERLKVMESRLSFTELEKRVMSLTEELWATLSTIIGDSPTAQSDLLFLGSHVRALQSTILAQVACRLNPTLFRAMGESS